MGQRDSKRKKMVTLKDVAKRAGVSPSTVSYVLNDKKKVREDTRDRIYSAVQELNYRPNRAARSLITKKSNTIGVMINSLSDLFFIDILRAIENVANHHQYNVILCDANNSERREANNLENLLSQRIDGLIYAGAGKNSKISLENIGIPVVTLDRSAGEGDGTIYMNHVEGGQLATEHLINKGKTPVAMITYPTAIATFSNRLKGYKKALEKHNIPFDEARVVVAQFGTSTEGYDATIELLKREVAFQSLFGANDILAIGAIRALTEKGFKVPEDVSVVGYDDIPISKMLVPSLTTIKQPQYKIGEKAAQLLLRMVYKENLKKADKRIQLQPQLIKRETVG